MKKKLLSIITVFISTIIVVSTLATVSLTASNVSFTIVPNPEIDVVLTKSKTNTNVTNFKNDLLNALEAQGINRNLVNITSVEAENVNIASGFSWNQDISSSIGSISITNGGKDVEMIGNRSNPGKNAIWIIPDGNQEQEFNFSYNIDYGDSFNAAGMLLRVQQTGNTLTGYMLSFNNSSGSDWYSAAGSRYGAIWKFTYVIGQNTTNMTKTLLQGLNINKSGTLNVKVTDSQIIVSGGGAGTVTYNFTEEYGIGYGFFSDHYSHNCDEIGSFKLTGIGLTATKVRKFTEVLREPTWRDNSIRVLVNISDAQNEELNTTDQLGELVTRLVNENINFVGWGKSATQSEIQNIIRNNNGNGKFINNTNYNNSITQTAIYIKSLIDSIDQDDNYLILGDKVNINMSPPDAANNTADSTYPYGKWKIDHDYDYFENHIGQFAQSGRYIDDFITQFNKTGKYTITYADSQITPSEVYVHRRPTAILKSAKNGNSITLVSNSSDLDSYSQGNKGIAEEEWKYKKTTDTNWTTGKLTTMDNTSDYVVQLRVKDFQGVWSYPVSVYATNRIDALPIASFGITNREMSRYETLEVIDTSYDPYGGTITSWTWELYKGNTRVYSGSTVPGKTTYNTVGDYTLRLTVKNNRGLTSETFSRTFKIIEDDIAPGVTIEPLTSDWTQSVDVSLEFYDDGGSGFKRYRYAITDSQATPTTWSNYITSSKGTITIDTESIKYLHIIAEDNAGNVSEDRVAGPYHIDKTAPTITVTPQSSDWARETQVQVSFTDAGSGYKHYKYAITDSRNMPTTWSEYITKSTDTITINTESEKYLHIIAEDNAGNVSEDNVTGAYLIDRTDPTIQVIGDLKTIVIDELTLNLQANDVPSGVETFKLDGEIIFNGNHTFYKNGTHTLEAVDKAGNTYTTEFTITNIYYECDAGLEHPIYSSDYDSCPICEAFKGLAVTNVKDVYNSEKQGVKYDNPRGAEIVEYYDGIKENPEDAKEYDYELKVVYEGEEYKTGLIGKYTITPKVITIEDILATNKVYNGNTTVVVSGGRLIGVCEGDNLQFELPMTGEAETKNVGRWKVAIEKINLIGEDAENYILTHPTYGDIMVEITPRPLRVINLNGKNRIYNKETTVEIEGGEFDNLVEGDDVVADIPETGESEDPNTGTWRVSIEEITLSGKDAGNYTFTQPEYGEIMVTISKETGTLEIGCESKKYDRELIEPYVINKNTTSEVTYKYYKAGTDEEVERPYDIGEYDVVAYAETDGNYTEIESNKVTFEITKPDAPMIGIESRVVKVNEQTVTAEEQPADMEYGDLVTIEIRIRNEGIGSGYAKEVTSTIADGMEYVEDNEINKANGWVLDGKKVTTNKYSYEADMDNELYPKSEEGENDSNTPGGDNTGIGNNISGEENSDNTEDKNNNENNANTSNESGTNTEDSNLENNALDIIPEEDNQSRDTASDSDIDNEKENNIGEGSNNEEDSEKVPDEETPEVPEQEKNTGRHTLQLVLRVTKNDKTQDRLLSQITVKQQDKRGDVVEYTEEDKENSKNRVEMQYTYTDLKIEKRITQILTTDKTTNTVKKYDMYQEPGKIVKLELPNKNIENTKLTITYEIKVTNVGNHNAEINEIVDLIPTGAIFAKEGNEGWYVGESGHIIYDQFEDYLRPKEEKSIKLKLTYELDEDGIAQIQNDAYLLATTDLDERIITEGNKKIEDTNNYAKSELIVSVITGETIIIYILAILGGMLIVVTGISLIKKYIL